MSQCTTNFEAIKKRKQEEDKLSEDFKPPKVTKKQSTIDFKNKVSDKPTPSRTSQCLTDVGRAINLLERVIARQDRAQECIDHLTEIFSRAAQDDSSDEPVGDMVSKKL